MQDIVDKILKKIFNKFMNFITKPRSRSESTPVFPVMYAQ